MLRLSTFGNLAIELDGRPVSHLASRKAEALLVYLRVVLSSLRKELGDYVEITRETAGIRPEAEIWLDVAQLEPALHERLSAATAAEYEAAVALYRGEYLAGFFLQEASRLEEWQVRERERLHRLALDGRQRLVEQALSCGNYGAGTAHAHRLLELEPLSETAHRQLMELLARSGQREQALAQYDHCRAVLAEELGLEPAAETVALAAAIRVGQVAPPTAAAAPPHNLPPQPTAFVGREHELQALEAMLTGEDGRLVTILGPGGSGKTRLALAAAERLLAADGRPGPFPDGAFFVPLAAVEDPAELPAAVVRAMGVNELETEPAALRQQALRILADKRLLLVLDNFEQLVAGAGWLAEVIQAAEQVRLLVTSRARLKLRAEQLFPLAGLPYAEWQDAAEAEGWSAARLFIQAARRVRPDFSLDGHIGALSEICRLVDGLPLALELAAGWVALLTLPEIAAEIQRGLDLLETELADLPERHRSIRALLDGTWRRLRPDEQHILGRLSVFRGGFTRQAAAAVAGADLKQLIGLANQSLIQPQPGRERYDMHPLLRQYARGRLDETEQQAALDAHCAYFCNWLGELTPDLWLAMPAPLEAVENDLRNVRQAWRRAAEQADFAHLDKAALGLFWFFYMPDRVEDLAVEFGSVGERLVSMARTPGERRVMAKLLACATWNKPIDEASAVMRQGLVWLDEAAAAGLDVRAERAFVMQRLGHELVPWHAAESRQLLAESCDLYRELDDRPALAVGLWVRSFADNSHEAVAFAQEACDLYEQVGAIMLRGHCLATLASYLMESNQVDTGLQRLEEAEAIVRAAGDQTSLADFLVAVSTALRLAGRLSRALEISQEATLLNAQLYARNQNLARRRWQLIAGLHSARILLHLNRYSAVEGAIIDLGDFVPEEYQLRYAFLTAYTRGVALLAQTEVVEAQNLFWRAEKRIPGNAQEAQLRACQALAAVAEGQPQQARGYLLTYLEPAVAEKSYDSLLAFVVPAAAVWMAAQGQIERALEL